MLPIIFGILKESYIISIYNIFSKIRVKLTREDWGVVVFRNKTAVTSEKFDFLSEFEDFLLTVLKIESETKVQRCANFQIIF